MVFNFINNSSQIVNISLNNDRESKNILPYENIFWEIELDDTLKIVLKQNRMSYFCIVKSHYKYCLLIETTYVIKNICDGMTFEITREKTEFRYGTLYDRFFINLSPEYIFDETNSIIGEKEIKNIYNHKRIKEILFTDPFVTNLSCVFWIPVISAILCRIFGWRYFILFACALWIFTVFINWVESKIVDTVFNKLFRKKSDKREFYEFFTEKYISDYYSEPYDYRSRKAVGDIEH